MSVTPTPGGPLARAATRAAATLGIAAGQGFTRLARARQARPLHPRGATVSAVLRIDEHDAATGMPALDSPGDLDCVVRLSRGAGTRIGRIDVLGLALAVRGAGLDGDDAHLLLASTGLGPVSRHLLALRRRVDAGALGVLWPYLTPTGSVMLAALPLGPVDEEQPTGARFAVGAGHGRGPWTRIGTLVLTAPVEDDTRFDTVLHPPAGARQYPWVEAVRAPAYTGARLGWTTPPQTRSMGR